MFAASAGSPSWSVDADFQFHRRIAEAANNRYYVDLLVSLGTTMIATPPTRPSTSPGDQRACGHARGDRTGRRAGGSRSDSHTPRELPGQAHVGSMTSRMRVNAGFCESRRQMT